SKRGGPGLRRWLSPSGHQLSLGSAYVRSVMPQRDSSVRRSDYVHLSELARKHGDKPAVIDGRSGEVLSFVELEAASNRIARALEGIGLRRGDHVAILAENTL